MKKSSIVKVLPLFFLLFSCSFSSQAQRLAKVIVKTTTPLKEALDAAKEAGKVLKMGSKDYDVNSGKITIWKTYYAPGSEQQFQVIGEVKDNKTILTIRCPNPANSMGSFIPEVKKFVKTLVVANKEVGEYFDGIE